MGVSRNTLEHHNNQGWWNIRIAAQYLGVSVAFVRKLTHRQAIPFVRVGSKAIRFRQADLDRWMEQNSAETEASVRR